MKTTAYPLSHYVDRLNAGEHFSFARYGDGEWLAILGATGENCDGHPYTPALARELGAAVCDPPADNYIFASRVTKEIAERVDLFCVRNDVRHNWHSTEVFLDASLRGKLAPFVTAIRDRSITGGVAYVGPAHLSHFAKSELGAGHFIPVPERNAYAELDRLTMYTTIAIEDGTDTILVSAGPAANALIHRLYSQVGQRVTMLDMGSVFDAYVGVRSRSYSKRGPYDFGKLFEANFR